MASTAKISSTSLAFIWFSKVSASDGHPDPVGVQVLENEKANNNIEVQEAWKNEFPNNSTEEQILITLSLRSQMNQLQLIVNQ